MNTYRLMAVLVGLIAPIYASAANYCIEVNGGFGSGGTSYIGRDFSVPSEGNCTPWSGFTKTASSVVAVATGTGCLSSNGKVLTVSISSNDPSYIGATPGSDYIQLCPAGVSSCPISGWDQGYFGGGGAAKAETCTSSLLNLPATHD